MFRLVRGPIDAEELRRAVAGPKNGAVVVFHGDARGETDGRRVEGLAYEAYEEMAVPALQALGAEMRKRHGVSAVACTHRLGPVPVGESAVVVAVSAPHREPALAAVADFVLRLKQDVPIWKQERFEDGAVWVGSPKPAEGQAQGQPEKQAEERPRQNPAPPAQEARVPRSRA